MVTYCMGSARQKREYFRKAEGAVMLDNVEVLFCASENGKNYFALGDVPFSSFTVREYLTYARALETEKVSDIDIAAFGLSPSKKLGRLCQAQMRTVTFLEKTAGDIGDKAVVINLDGTRYSKRNKRALDILLSHAGEAYVCVTDRRFLRHAAPGHKLLLFGKTVKTSRPAFYFAKRLAKKLGARRVAVM